MIQLTIEGMELVMPTTLRQMHMIYIAFNLRSQVVSNRASYLVTQLVDDDIPDWQVIE